MPERREIEYRELSKIGLYVCVWSGTKHSVTYGTGVKMYCTQKVCVLISMLSKEIDLRVLNNYCTEIDDLPEGREIEYVNY